MSTPTSAGRTPTLVAIVIGLLLLALITAFAVGLPKVEGDEAGHELTLTLPDTLPGGYVASDDPEAFVGGQLADQADEIAEQEAANREYGDAALPEALGTAAVTRTYVADGTEAVFVQAFQSTGGAFAPNSIPAPADASGQVGTEVVAVGDGACILSYGQAQTEGAEPPVAFSQCQVSHGEITVQIGSSAVSAEDLVSVADELLETLQES